jgi:hypothetical protein
MWGYRKVTAQTGPRRYTLQKSRVLFTTCIRTLATTTHSACRCQLVRSMITAMVQLASLVGALVVVFVVGFLVGKYGRIDPWM